MRLFGARIGEGVVIKPAVRIGCPWLLSIGHHSWIGEGVRIDNSVGVTIGANGTCLATTGAVEAGSVPGAFERPILIEDGARVAACVVLAPGVRIGRDAVVTRSSVVTHDVPMRAVVIAAADRPSERRLQRRALV
nr:hypothetical protein [Acuticoccus kalidii]